MNTRNKNIISPEEVDRLLDAYYNGSTTTGQEEALMQYFCALEHVPERYAADAALFRALRDARDSLCNIEVPVYLEQKIAGATYARKHRASGLLYYIRWLSAAAAVAILAVVAMNLQRDSRPDVVSPLYVASELRRDSVVHVVDNMAEVKQDTVVMNPVEKVAVDVAPKRPMAKARPSVQADVDPYVEVTDSAAVAGIMDDVLGKLRSSLAVADNGVRRTGIALNMTETINKALKQ